MLRISALPFTAIFAQVALAGGFWLTLGNPGASSDPKAKNAVMLVRPDGCHEPAKAAMSATAEGLADGVRRSIPIKLTPLSTPGTYAIHKQWPHKGTWVLSITATDAGRTTAAVVPVNREGFQRKSAKFVAHAPNREEIESVLQAAVQQVALTQ